MAIDWLEFFQNIIPVSGIIIALISPAIPLIFVPVLDYSFYETSVNSTEFTSTYDVKINNYGIVPAKNVTVSIIAGNASIVFLSSDPFLPNQTRSFTSDVLSNPGKGIFEFDKLLPRSQSIVHVKIDNISNQNIIPYVQSDEVVGYHGVYFVMLAYVVLTAALLIGPVIVFKLQGWSRTFLIILLSAISAILIALFFFLSCVPCNVY